MRNVFFIKTVFNSNIYVFSASCISLHWHFPRLSVPCHSFKLAWLSCHNIIFSHLERIKNILPFGLYQKYSSIWSVSKTFYHLDCINNILPFEVYQKYSSIWNVSQLFSHLDCITIEHILPLNFNLDLVTFYFSCRQKLLQ